LIFTIVAGHLHIGFVKREDLSADKVWKCYITNHILSVDVGGSDSKIVDSGQTESE